MNGNEPLKVNNSTENLPATPQQKFESIFEKFEMMVTQQNGGGLDLGSLNDQQRDRLLSVVEKNEDHTFDYYKEKLRIKKEIRLAEIQAGNFTFKTNRITLITVLIALFAVTVLILLTKDSYFVPWLTFLTGLLGGYGFAKTQRSAKMEKKEDA
jgi:hypothetical protein